MIRAHAHKHAKPVAPATRRRSAPGRRLTSLIPPDASLDQLRALAAGCDEKRHAEYRLFVQDLKNIAAAL